MDGFLIGELAQRADVKAQTIRYYERLGLRTAARRTAAGYRRYGREAVAELRFIKKAQALGFSLDDIKRILDLGRAGHAPCSTVLALASAHLIELDERINQLRQLREGLGAALQRWQNGGVPPNCAATLCGLISDVTNGPENGREGDAIPHATRGTPRRESVLPRAASRPRAARAGR